MNLLQMSFWGGILILAVLIVRAAAINRLPKGTFLTLWCLILIRLLVPFSVQSPFNVFSLIYKSLPTGMQSTLNGGLGRNIMPVTPDGQIDPITPAPPEPLTEAASHVSIWLIIWVAGMIICAGFLIASYVRCRLEFRTSIPVNNGYAKQWIKDHQLKIRKVRISIRQSDRISAPLTYGIVRPVILMPKKTDWNDREKLDCIFLHEYIHICHCDVFIKIIATIALCIHWFNPLVWVMYIIFNRDIELFCDECVVKRFGEKSKVTYAMTLIAMEEKKRGLAPLCNNFSKNAIEERITAIMKTKKTTAVTAIIAILLITVVACACAAAPQEDDSQVGSQIGGGSDIQEKISEGINVPETVIDAAAAYVEEQYNNAEGSYKDWRIEALRHACTYDPLEDMTLQIYQMNYKFLAEDPENIQLVGGMTMSEDGWVVPTYEDCTFLIFKQEGETLTYLSVLMENDCSPGDDTFTEDVRRRIKGN